MQGLQLESADRLAAQQRAEKELTTIQEANKELQAVAARAEEARQELVPAGELEAARSALGAAEQRVADLERELRRRGKKRARQTGELRPPLQPQRRIARCRKSLLLGFRTTTRCFSASSRDSPARCLVSASSLSVSWGFCGVRRTHHCLLLAGRVIASQEEASSLDARQCVRMLVDSATLSATCIRAYLQEMSPTEVIPSDLVEVWEYLEKAPAVVEFMTRSAFRRGASTALSLGLAHFPEDFDLDDVTSGYPSSTGAVDLSEVLKLQERAATYSERVWAMGDLLPYQEMVIAPNDPEPPHRDFKVEQPFRAAMAGELTTYPSHPYTAFIRRRQDSGASSSKPAE